MPFLIKDLYAHIQGQPLTNGIAALAAELPRSEADTTLVARYRAAGLVFAGRRGSGSSSEQQAQILDAQVFQHEVATSELL